MPEYDKKRPRSSGAAVRRKKKQNIFAALITGLLPWKGDDKGTVVRKIVFLASLVLIIYAIYMLADFYVFRDARMKAEIEAIEKLKNDYTGDETLRINLGDLRPDSADSTEEDEEVEIIGEYLEYFNRNNDFVGYVEIYPIIQYPVLQTTDNEFYLHHNFDKVPTENGTIFADYEGVFTSAERPHNTILYGHNLITKYYFQPLVNYRDKFDFLVQHPKITFDTLYERGEYKIFALFLTNVNPARGEIFPYWQTVYFSSKSQFDNYIAECLDRSYYYTGVDLEYGDEIITLSTCDFSVFSDDMRLVLMARRVREGENPTVDTDRFIDNRGTDENGLMKREMFDAYYNVYAPGGWAGRNWDPLYIKDFENY